MVTKQSKYWRRVTKVPRRDGEEESEGIKREDNKRARLIRFLTCRTVRAGGCPFELLSCLCAVAAAASLLHGVVCLVWQGKVWMGLRYGLGWMDCLDCLDGDGMVWVWMRVCVCTSGLVLNPNLSLRA